MSYSVTWRPEAEDELADVWTSATDRNAVARAADAFDADVAANPFAVGESRAGRTRIAFVDPLAFIFDVFPESRQVLVKTVWRNRP